MEKIALAFILFVVNCEEIRSIYKEIFDLGNEEMKEKEVAVTSLNKVFHQCSMTDACKYVVQNATTGTFAFHFATSEIPGNRALTRIWRKQKAVECKIKMR